MTKFDVSWVYCRNRELFCSLTNAADTSVRYPLSPEPKPEFLVDGSKWLRIAMRRLGANRGKDGFGNARAVRQYFDSVLLRQSTRPTAAGTEDKCKSLHVLTRGDLLGAKATREAFERSAAWAELQAMEGLEEVKQSVRQLMELAVQNAEREEEEKPVLQVALNRLFLGNPGTGKTTVAKLYARILADLGLLSKGEVIVKTPSDFKGRYVGDSEAQTRAILESAMGSVLVIDEAYGLCPSKGAR